MALHYLEMLNVIRRYQELSKTGENILILPLYIVLSLSFCVPHFLDLSTLFLIIIVEYIFDEMKLHIITNKGKVFYGQKSSRGEPLCVGSII